MKKYLKVLSISLLALFTFSCMSNTLTSDQVKAKVYSNNFSFVAKDFENNLRVNVPEGTGRILSTNTPTISDETIGITVSHDKLKINLPSNDQETVNNTYSLNKTSENFTVSRRDLENGNILVNFFLKDHKELNLVKMEIDKDGKIDCSVEGPNQKPLFYVGYLR